MSDIWAADVEVSLPQPIKRRPPVVDFGGFAFTTGGMIHNLTDAEAEELGQPYYAPAHDRPVTPEAML